VWKFVHRTQVEAPLEAVAHLHKDSQALKRLTPPPVIVQLHYAEALRDGSRTDFTMWFGPLPVRWTAIHSQVNVLRGFTDTQLQGPFRSWEHRHTFIPISAKQTEIMDEIQAEAGNGLLNGCVSRFMWYTLPLMFSYRGWVIRRSLVGGKHPTWSETC
jgi:ligand-binding SRPBCC domain-containing protein